MKKRLRDSCHRRDGPCWVILLYIKRPSQSHPFVTGNPSKLLISLCVTNMVIQVSWKREMRLPWSTVAREMDLVLEIQQQAPSLGRQLLHSNLYHVTRVREAYSIELGKRNEVTVLEHCVWELKRLKQIVLVMHELVLCVCLCVRVSSNLNEFVNL